MTLFTTILTPMELMVIYFSTIMNLFQSKENHLLNQ